LIFSTPLQKAGFLFRRGASIIGFAMNDDKNIAVGAAVPAEAGAYEAEARTRWGRTAAYRQSQERVKKFTPEDWRRIREENEANLKTLTELLRAGQAAGDPAVQAEVAKHHAGICRFYDCSAKMYRGLAEMYLRDQRFADHYRRYDPALPEFLARAMEIFADGMA